MLANCAAQLNSLKRTIGSGGRRRRTSRHPTPDVLDCREVKELFESSRFTLGTKVLRLDLNCSILDGVGSLRQNKQHVGQSHVIVIWTGCIQLSPVFS